MAWLLGFINANGSSGIYFPAKVNKQNLTALALGAKCNIQITQHTNSIELLLYTNSFCFTYIEKTTAWVYSTRILKDINSFIDNIKKENLVFHGKIYQAFCYYINQ